MSTQTFNHELENTDAAVGLNTEQVQDKINKVVSSVKEDEKGNAKQSEVIEALSKELTPVELAFTLNTVLGINNQLRKELQLTSMLLSGAKQALSEEKETVSEEA